MRESYDASARRGRQPPPPGQLLGHDSAPDASGVIGLVVDDDASVILTLTRMLNTVATEVLAAQTAADARTLALARQPHFTLLDVRLKADDGLDWLAEMRALGVVTRVVVVSGFLDDDVERRAEALGALAVLAKPVLLDEVVGAVRHVMQCRAPLGDAWAAGLEGSAAQRWVSIVVSALGSPDEPYVREELTRRGAVSLTTLKRICARVGIEPHDTRDLARMLCLLVWSRRLGVPAEVLSRASEPTFDRLVRRSGVADHLDQATVRDLLDHQQFVPRATFAFRLLRRALLGEPIRTSASD
jgi:ActR/RegA family two-component response regulator